MNAQEKPNAVSQSELGGNKQQELLEIVDKEHTDVSEQQIIPDKKQGFIILE